MWWFCAICKANLMVIFCCMCAFYKVIHKKINHTGDTCCNNVKLASALFQIILELHVHMQLALGQFATRRKSFTTNCGLTLRILVLLHLHSFLQVSLLCFKVSTIYIVNVPSNKGNALFNQFSLTKNPSSATIFICQGPIWCWIYLCIESAQLWLGAAGKLQITSIYDLCVLTVFQMLEYYTDYSKWCGQCIVWLSMGHPMLQVLAIVNTINNGNSVQL